ncbi:AAA+ ATPase domain-containing protein [Deinococcus saxicola]|uniref:GspE/PulE family protein n=1 Tax=Deinococcus saxicola TaxID=249406 RepID=UPI0039EF736E
MTAPEQLGARVSHAETYREVLINALAQYGYPRSALSHPSHSPLAQARRAGVGEHEISGAMNLINYPVATGAAAVEDSLPGSLYIGVYDGANVYASPDPFDLDVDAFVGGLVAFHPLRAAAAPPEQPAPQEARQSVAGDPRTVMEALYLLGFGQILPGELGEANYHTALLQTGRITHEQLAQAYARLTRRQYINPRVNPPQPGVRNALSHSVISRFSIVPHSRSGNVLTVLMSDPTDQFSVAAAEDELQGVDIVVAVATAPDIDDLMRTVYRRAAHDEALEAEARTRRRSDDDTERADASGPVAQRILLALEEATANNASDLHFQPEADGLHVRERLYGTLITRSVFPPELSAKTINQVKIMAGMSLESRLPQDRRINITVTVHGQEQTLRLRVSSLRSNHGDSVVMRLLRDVSTLPTLEESHFTPHNLALIRAAIASSSGMLLVTGPTGSGKTTLMHTILSAVNAPALKIMTIEEPIEYEQPGFVQTEVFHTDDPATSLTFERVLKAQLRQDPDVIFVGETRDKETALTAVQAAQTGHLLLSTVHTNSALATPGRLVDLGVERYLVAESLRAVVAQRLVGQPCPECAVQEPMPAEYAPQAGATMLVGTGVKNGQECPLCSGTGSYKVIPLHEVLTFTDEVKAAVASGNSAELKLAAVQAGLRTLREDGMDKVARHLANLKSVLENVS